jgi:division protein CdvB (Snf7/Vps24/ESCRT-III family)
MEKNYHQLTLGRTSVELLPEVVVVQVALPEEVQVVEEFLVQTAVFVQQQARAAVPPEPEAVEEEAEAEPFLEVAQRYPQQETPQS